MNSVSLLLNGRTAADIALLPEKQRSSLTALPRRTMSSAFSSPPASPALSARSSRPSMSRRSSKESSPGWYNQENNLTLDDFARRLNTTSKKIEIWQGRCAQNVVMALMRPTPLVLFVLNPLSLLVWIVLGWWWFTSGS